MKTFTATATTESTDDSRTTGVPQRRRNLTIAAAAIAALSLSSCGAIVERATEKAVEEGVERAIEADSGEEVELDFDAGDGTFSIETEDGSFSVDGEDGTFVLETEDGTFEGSGDENGFEVTDENGSTVVDADFDDETGDGSIRIETVDGTFSAGEGDWGMWPVSVARPDFSADPVVGGVEEDGLVWAYANGEVTADAQAAVDTYVATLDGFDVTDTSTSKGYALARLSNGEFRVEVSATDNALSVSVSNG